VTVPAISAPATTVATGVEAKAMQAALTKQLADVTTAGVPGAVMYARHGTASVQIASGVADSDTGQPMIPPTRFRAGSVAKPFVATVVMQLREEQALSLDDTIERWLPGLVPDGGRITIRQLLGNRSGLFDFAEDPRVLQPYFDGDMSYVWAPADLVKVANEHPLNFQPGEGTRYSNTEYVILGMIIEKVTGHTFADEANTRIIEPLHLTSTVVPTNNDMATPFAHGYYIADGLQDVTALSVSMSSFGGNLVSTAEDLATFFTALLDGKPEIRRR
jgi:D-alanyl-D-alanine carboxypeptidase